MRQKYYELLKKYNIRDCLFLVEDLSYSRKFKIIDNLLKSYSPETINQSLNCYEFNYIRLNRVNIILIENILKNNCKRISTQNKEC